MKKLNNYDNAAIAGNNYAELREAIEHIDSVTKSLVVKNMDKVDFLGYSNWEPKEGVESYTLFSDETLVQEDVYGVNYPHGYISPEEIPQSFLDENKKSSKLILRVATDSGNEKFIISGLALPTLTIWAGVKGFLAINSNTLARNAFLAECCKKLAKKTFHLVYREMDGVKKIYGVLGNRFSPIPQHFLLDALDSIIAEEVMGEATLKAWQINHEFTRIFVTFPEAAEALKETYSLKKVLTPGLVLQTGDTGASSLTAKAVFYTSDHNYVLTDEVRFMHTTAVTKERFLEGINDSIFPAIRKLPELLMELSDTLVLDYSTLDISTEAGQETNKRRCMTLIEKALKSAFKKEVSADKTKALVEALSDDLAWDIQYTWGDLAFELLDVPERMVLEDSSNTYEESIRSGCAHAPYELQKLLKKETSKSSKVTLV